MGLGWNWRESIPCNLLIARRLSVDYTLLRSSISEKRPSSFDTGAPWWDTSCAAVVEQCLCLVRVRFRSVSGSCTRVCALVAQAGVPAAVSCAYSSGAVACWDMHGLSFKRRGVVHGFTDIGVHSRFRLLLNRVQSPVLEEWQGETRLRAKLLWAVCNAVGTVLCKDAGQVHEAVDLGCNESAQPTYKRFPRVFAGYRQFLRSWEGDFHQLTRVWDDAWNRKLGVDGCYGVCEEQYLSD